MEYFFNHNNFKKIMVIFTLHLIGVFAFINVYPVQSISPELIKYFNATPVQIGLAVGSTIFAISITSPFIGIISDKLGRKNIIITSIDMVKNMSFYISGTVFGGFLGRFIIGHVSHITNWHYGFIFMSILNLIGTIFIYMYLPDSKNFKPIIDYKSVFSTAKSLFKNPYLISPCILGFCILFSLVSCFTFINVHLSKEPYNLTTANLSNIFMVYLFGIISTPLSIKLIIKFGIKKVVYFSIITSIIGIILTLNHNLILLIIGLIIISCGISITQYSTVSYISTNIIQGRSLASGLYYFMYYMGGTVGSWVCGYAYMFGNWSLTVIFILIIQLIGLLITFLFLKDY